jgi:hypothetical protein
VSGLGPFVYHGHPDIETLNRPPRIDGVENWRPRDASESWSFRVRDGVTDLHFGDPGWRLGYARDAVNSYFVFKTLREKGQIPEGVRFQVCLPMTYSGFISMFRDPSDWPIVARGFEEAMRAEVAMIARKIPNDDLAIQWDLCPELGMVERTGGQSGNANWDEVDADPLDLVSEAIEHMASAVPSGVTLGFHLCYGTLGGWPMRRGVDLEMVVKLIHAMRARSERKVDYVHAPILDHVPAEYFEPLKDLDAGDTQIYVGVIHNMDDLQDFEHKLTECSRYLDDFGIGAPCGFGRATAEEMPRILQDHAKAVEICRSLTG